jgi:hypothetical protein
MEEIRISLNQATFTQLCKVGFLFLNSQKTGRIEIYITKQDMREISSGSVLKKITQGISFEIALQDIGSDLIREIIKRSPIYSDMI